MEMQPKQLEDENPKLKGMADDLSLDIKMLQHAICRKL
jgi:hypothetical protein